MMFKRDGKSTAVLENISLEVSAKASFSVCSVLRAAEIDTAQYDGGLSFAFERSEH